MKKEPSVELRIIRKELRNKYGKKFSLSLHWPGRPHVLYTVPLKYIVYINIIYIYISPEDCRKITKTHGLWEMGKELKKQRLSRLQLCSNTQAMSEGKFVLYKPKMSSLVHGWNDMNGGMYQRHPQPCVMHLMQSAKQKAGPFTAASKR